VTLSLDELIEVNSDFFDQRGYDVYRDYAFKEVGWTFSKYIEKNEEKRAVEVRTNDKKLPKLFIDVVQQMKDKHPSVKICIEVQKENIKKGYVAYLKKCGVSLLIIESNKVIPVDNLDEINNTNLESILQRQMNIYEPVHTLVIPSPPFDDEAFYAKHNKPLTELAEHFAQYGNVDRPAIRAWLNQFKGNHKEIGLKLLRAIKWYDKTRVNIGLQTLLNEVKRIESDGLEGIFFSSLGIAGKSGHEILTMFRRANGMSTRRYDEKFKYKTDFGLLPEDSTVILLDDFIGTGKQAFDYLKVIKEIRPDGVRFKLAVLVGCEEGIREIEKSGYTVITVDALSSRDKIFSRNNTEFTKKEKEVLKSYCQLATEYPTGYGDSQAYIVFHYRTPNNTISILRANNARWLGLFPRH